MRMHIGAILAIMVFAATMAGCGGETMIEVPQPSSGSGRSEESGAYGGKPYRLSATERPDFDKLVLHGSELFISDRVLWKSADGFVLRLTAQLGTKHQYMYELDSETIDAAKVTLFGDDDAVMMYYWFINHEGYIAFADGPIWKATRYKSEVLALKPFDNRVRITLMNEDETPITDGAGIPVSREFTVVGIKPAEPTSESQQ